MCNYDGKLVPRSLNVVVINLIMGSWAFGTGLWRDVEEFENFH